MSVARDLLDGRVTLGELRGYHPSAIAALCHDALALHENGRTDEAMVMLRGLRALEPANVQVLRLLGLILTGAARTEALGISTTHFERRRAMRACAWRGLGFGCSSVMDEAQERT